MTTTASGRASALPGTSPGGVQPSGTEKGGSGFEGGSQHPRRCHPPRWLQGRVPQQRPGARVCPGFFGRVGALRAGAGTPRGPPGHPTACLSFPTSLAAPFPVPAPRTGTRHRLEGQSQPSVSVPLSLWMRRAGGQALAPGWVLITPSPLPDPPSLPRGWPEPCTTSRPGTRRS